MNAKLAWASMLLFIDFLAKPTLSLFTVVMILIALDFLTGVTKAKLKKQDRTSEGYRKTVTKLLQYMIPILVLWGASKFLPENKEMLQKIAGWVMMFINYIEATSIFENLYEIDKNSIISKFIYRPALLILKFGIEHNPVTKAADQLEKQQEEAEKNNAQPKIE